MTNLEQANALFEHFVGDSRINWNLTHAGCEARADLLAEIAGNQQIQVKKIWVLPGEDSLLTMYLNTRETERIAWNYHVAVTCQVGDTLASTAMVFDPALFDSVTLLSDWEKRFLQYNPDCLFKVSDMSSYHSYDDISFPGLAEINRAERDSTLSSNWNSDDSDTLAGREILGRGRYVDNLALSSPKRFDKLKHRITETRFSEFWLTHYGNQEIKDILKTTGQWMSISQNILHPLIEEPLLGLRIKLSYWETIADFFTRLEADFRQLRQNGDALHNDFIRESLDEGFVDRWFSPDGHALWEKYLP